MASKSRLLVTRLKAAGHEIVLSPSILAEVESKLRTKTSLRAWLKRTDEQIDIFLAELPLQCVEIPGDVEAPGSVPADPDDEKVIAAAIEARAEYIVSEDKHLRALGTFAGIRILNRDEMLAELDRLESGPSGELEAADADAPTFPDTDAEE